MRKLILLVGSLFALVAALSACGTKGPLTLPPKAEEAKAAKPSTSPTTTPATPAKDANTVDGKS